jgi:peptide/nickel transport system permease protein
MYRNSKLRFKRFMRDGYLYTLRLWRSYKRYKVGVAGIYIVLFFTILAILAPVIATHSVTFRAPLKDVYIVRSILSNFRANSSIITGPVVIVPYSSYSPYFYLVSRHGTFYSVDSANLSETWSMQTGIKNINGFSYGIVINGSSMNSYDISYDFVGVAYNSSGYFSIIISTVTNRYLGVISKPAIYKEFRLPGKFINPPVFNAYRTLSDVDVSIGTSEYGSTYPAYLYAATVNGTIYGIRLPTTNNGSIGLWYKKISNFSLSEPFIYGITSYYSESGTNRAQLVLTTSANGTIFCLNARSSQIYWSLSMGRGSFTDHTVIRTIRSYEYSGENVVFIPMANGSLLYLDPMLNYSYGQNATYIHYLDNSYAPFSVFVAYDNLIIVSNPVTMTTYLFRIVLSSNYSVSSELLYSVRTYNPVYSKTYYDPFSSQLFILDSAGYMYAVDIPGNGFLWISRVVTVNTTYYAMIRVIHFGNGSSSAEEVVLPLSDGGIVAYTATGINLMDSDGGALSPSLSPYPSGNVYYLGTTPSGRDVYSLYLYATQTELIVALASAFLSTLIGLFIGVIAGYYGRSSEKLLMGMADVVFFLPFLALVIVLEGLFGGTLIGESYYGLIVIFSITSWPVMARMTKNRVKFLKNNTCFENLRIMGASNRRIIFRHILPEILPVILMVFMLIAGGVVITDAAISFLGLGPASINYISWGKFLYDAMQINYFRVWWLTYPAGLSITALAMSFFAISRGFDDIVNNTGRF